MGNNRCVFKIAEVGDPRHVGNPTLREAPEFPSVMNRLGTGIGIVLQHTALGFALTGGAALLLSYAVYIVLLGGVNALAALFTGEVPSISLTDMQIILENYFAFLKENF